MVQQITNPEAGNPISENCQLFLYPCFLRLRDRWLLPRLQGCNFTKCAQCLSLFSRFTTNRLFLYLELDARHVNGRNRRVCGVR